jgi:hypothetical protein
MTGTLRLNAVAGPVWVRDRYAFRQTAPEYVNAWGQLCVRGVTFDLATMTRQTDRVAWGSPVGAVTVDDIVDAALRQAVGS